jgi:hypothetical protein
MRKLTWLASLIVIFAVCGWYYQNAQVDVARETEEVAGDAKKQDLLLEHKKSSIEKRFNRIRDGMSFEAVSKIFRFYKVTEMSSEDSLKTYAFTDGPFGIVVTFRNGRVVSKTRQ